MARRPAALIPRRRQALNVRSRPFQDQACNKRVRLHRRRINATGSHPVGWGSPHRLSRVPVPSPLGQLSWPVRSSDDRPPTTTRQLFPQHRADPRCRRHDPPVTVASMFSAVIGQLVGISQHPAILAQPSTSRSGCAHDTVSPCRGILSNNAANLARRTSSRPPRWFMPRHGPGALIITRRHRERRLTATRCFIAEASSETPFRVSGRPPPAPLSQPSQISRITGFTTSGPLSHVAGSISAIFPASPTSAPHPPASGDRRGGRHTSRSRIASPWLWQCEPFRTLTSHVFPTSGLAILFPCGWSGDASKDAPFTTISASDLIASQSSSAHWP